MPRISQAGARYLAMEMQSLQPPDPAPPEAIVEHELATAPLSSWISREDYDSLVIWAMGLPKYRGCNSPV